MSFSYGRRWGDRVCGLTVMGTVLVFALFLQSGLGQGLFHSDGLIAPLRIMKSTHSLSRNTQENKHFVNSLKGFTDNLAIDSSMRNPGH